MKKLRLLLCLALAAALLTPAALADSIPMPNDPFAKDHSCRYLPRRYTANGAKGYVSLYENPLSFLQRENVANGEVFFCEFLYTDEDGETWAGVTRDYSNIRGWVKLSDCIVVYDYISFQEDHSAEYVPYDPERFPMGELGEELMLWPYPGADHIDLAMRNWPEGLADYFQSAWIDPEGRVWGYIGYLYGMRNLWVCISDPSNADLPAVSGDVPATVPPAQNIPAAGETAAAPAQGTPAVPDTPAPGTPAPGNAAVPPAEHVPLPNYVWVVGGLVALAVIVTAALIPLLSKKRKGR